LCTLGLECNVSYIQIYYIDDDISVIIIQGDTRVSDGLKKKYSVDIQLEMDLFVQK